MVTLIVNTALGVGDMRTLVLTWVNYARGSIIEVIMAMVMDGTLQWAFCQWT
jgi:hypothetical protein